MVTTSGDPEHVPPSRRRSTRVPLADTVHDALLVQFMRGSRPPGQWLNIEQLSRELHVSPTPIREALARLEHTGFVRREALRGYAVAPLLTPMEIVQLMDARLLLEPTLAAEATRHSTADFLAELASTIAVMEQVGDVFNGDVLRRSWLADESFHSLISRQAGNPFTERAYRSLGGQLQRFRLIGEAGISHAEIAAQEHRRILEAITDGDGESAAAHMRAHIERAKSRTLADQRVAESCATGAESSGGEGD
jgi:DNA-binding GntR family transcriptional regulator